MACAEDEDFIQALDKMMLENLQVHKHSLIKPFLYPSESKTDPLYFLNLKMCSFVAFSPRTDTVKSHILYASVVLEVCFFCIFYKATPRK